MLQHQLTPFEQVHQKNNLAVKFCYHVSDSGRDSGLKFAILLLSGQEEVWDETRAK